MARHGLLSLAIALFGASVGLAADDAWGRAKALALGPRPESAVPVLRELAQDARVTPADRLEAAALLARTLLLIEEIEPAGQAFAEAVRLARETPGHPASRQAVAEARAFAAWSTWRRREFEDLVLFYPPDSSVAEGLLRHKADIATQLKVLNDTFGVALPGRIYLFLYETPAQRDEVFPERQFWVSPEARIGHVVLSEGPGRAFLAVLTHLGGRGAALPDSPFMVEGMASRPSPKDRAALRKLGDLIIRESLPPLEELASSRAATAEAAMAGRVFCQMIQEDFGRQAFLALWYGYNQGPDPFRRALGADIRSLASRFHAHILRRHPDRDRMALAHVRAADTVLRLGYLDLAADHLRRALIYAPESALDRCNLALVHERMGDTTAALAQLRQAREGIADTKAIDARIAALEASQGKATPRDWWPVERWRVEMPAKAAADDLRVAADRPLAPAVLGRRAFVALSAGSEVVALDTESGAELWRYALSPEPPATGSRYRVCSTLRALRRAGDQVALLADRWEYAPDRPQKTALRAGALAVLLDPTSGKESARSVLPAPMSQTPSEAVAGRVVYGSEQRRQQRSAHAFDIATGAEMWKTPLDWRPDATPLLTATRALWLTARNEVEALDASTGQTAWRWRPDRGAIGWASDGATRLVVAGYDRTLRVLDLADGRETRQVPLDALPDRAMALAGNVLFYACAGEASVHALDIERGQNMWSRDLPRAAAREAMLLGPDTLFVSGLRDAFAGERPVAALLNAETGGAIWSERLGEFSSFAASEEGLIVATARDDGGLSCALLARRPGPPAASARVRVLRAEVDQRMRERQWDLAETLLEDCARLAPENAGCLAALGDCQMRQARYRYAAETWERLVRLNPPDADAVRARLERARTEQETLDRAEAER